MVQWFDKSSVSRGSYKDSVRSLAQSFVSANSPERSPVPLRSSRRSCYGPVPPSESNSYNTNQRSDNNVSRRVTSPAYSQSTNSSDGSSEYCSYSNYSSRPSTPVMSYNARNSRPSTPVMSYNDRNSRPSTPVGHNESNNVSVSTLSRKYITASCRCDTPIRFYENPPRSFYNNSSRQSTTPIQSSYNNPSSRSTTPMRSSYDNPPSQSTTSMRSSYNNSSSRSTTPMRSSYDNPPSRSTTPMRSSYDNPPSRPTTPMRSSYDNPPSRSTTPMRSSYDNPPSRPTTPMRSSYDNPSSRSTTPLRSTYDNPSSPSTTPMRSFYDNPSSRSTTPMRSFCTPSSRPSTPLGSYYTSNSRSGTPLRSVNGYTSRDSSPTPTIITPNESILDPIRNRKISTNNSDLPLPKSRADIIVPLKYYFTDVPHTPSTSQRCRSSSRSRSSCNGDDISQTNNVPLRCRSSSRSRSTCNGDTPQSRPRDLSLPRPKTVYSSTESSRNESDLNTLPRLSRRRGSYIESDSRSSSIARDMIGSNESLQNLINLPATKDIETRVKASMRSKLTLPSTCSDNIRSRRARSQYLSGVFNGNQYRDENGVVFPLN